MTINFRNVTKTYGEHPALHNVSFSIATGEFVCITGKSGEGKTTIAKLILGAETPSAGTVFVNGVSVPAMGPRELHTHRQHIGMVFQDFKLLPYKTVFENVAFVLTVCGESDQTIAARVPEVLSVVNMLHARDKFPHQLSGGEKQRVAIARAIAHRPQLVIADEPTGNLDHENSRTVITLLKRVNTFPTTVLLMTHDLNILKQAGSRIITLHQHSISENTVRTQKYDSSHAPYGGAATT